MPGRSLLVDRFRVLKVLLAMSLLPVSSTFLSAQTLVSISVSPGSASVAAGSTQSFSAIGTYRDNSTQDLSSMANWTSSDYTVASVAGGLANAFNVGQTTIQAKVGGVTGSATLAVTPGQLNAIVTPAYQPTHGSSGYPSQKAIAVGSDGFSRFVVGDSSGSGSDDEIVYVHCLDQDCTTSNTAIFQTGAWTSDYSMALARILSYALMPRAARGIQMQSPSQDHMEPQFP